MPCEGLSFYANVTDEDKTIDTPKIVSHFLIKLQSLNEAKEEISKLRQLATSALTKEGDNGTKGDNERKIKCKSINLWQNQRTFRYN